MTAKPAVHFITHEFFPKKGGIATYTENLAAATCNIGIETHIWAPKDKSLKSEDFASTLHPLNTQGTQNWTDRIQSSLALLKNTHLLAGQTLCLPEPGAIITLMYLDAIRKLPYKNLILILHGTEILTLTSTPWRKFLFKKLLNRASNIGVISRYTSSLLLERFPFVKDKLIRVPGAPKAYVEPKIQVQKSDKTTLLTVGRIHPRKGQLAVVEALKLLPQKLQQSICYEIAGPIIDINYKKKIEQLTQAYNLDVQFLGTIDEAELPQLYRNCDIFILTSMPYKKSIEGFGLVYLEAGIYSTPSIAHAIGGVPEVVINGKTGAVVPHDNRHQLAQAIEKLASDPSLRETLGSNAKIFAQSHSWEENAKKLFA